MAEHGPVLTQESLTNLRNRHIAVPAWHSETLICMICSDRWPCDAVAFYDHIAALDTAGRSAVRALEWMIATGRQYYLVSGYRAPLGYSRKDFDDAEDGLKQAMESANAVLDTDTARAWVREG